MTARLSSRSPIAIFAVVLWLATIVLLLALSPQALGRAHKAACPSSVTAHLRHGAHACVQATGASNPARKRKLHAHGHSNVKGHHSKHAAKKGRKKGTSRKPAQRGHTPAVCEDGSAPVNEGGSFSCADQSEPECPSGSIPVPSSDHSALLCDVKAGAPGPTEAVCEDGSAPVQAGDGSFSCDDESQPVCENGSVPMPSGGGTTLVCGAEPGENSGVSEVSCEDGTAPVLGGDGYYSCAGPSGPGCEGTTAPTLSAAHWTSVCDVVEPVA